MSKAKQFLKSHGFTEEMLLPNHLVISMMEQYLSSHLSESEEMTDEEIEEKALLYSNDQMKLRPYLKVSDGNQLREGFYQGQLSMQSRYSSIILKQKAENKELFDELELYRNPPMTSYEKPAEY